MTVNERLFTLGLLDDFQAAAQKRDRDAMIGFYGQIAFSREDAEAASDMILADPEFYGF